MLIASSVAFVSMLFPAAPDADLTIAFWTTLVAFVLGLVLTAGVADHASGRVFRAIIAFDIALACLGVYGGGSPTSGAQFFLLWASPLAFGFFNIRQASLQLAWLAVAYAAVLWLQHHQHPDIGSLGLLVGMWFIVIATCLVVGLLLRRIARSLRDVDRRLRRAFEDSPVASAFLSSDFEFLQTNEAFDALLGRPSIELVGHGLSSITHPDDLPALARLSERIGEGTVRLDVRFVSHPQQIISTVLSGALITPEVGAPYVFMQFIDVTDHVRDREALAKRAILDPLTGLFNRTLLIERLTSALEVGAGRETTAVLMIDLDQFKVINDSLGHEVGDQLLVALAPRLESALQPGDTLSRFGGDEFVVLCENLHGIDDAVARAKSLAVTLSQPVSLASGEHLINASIGVAISDDPLDDAPSLLRDADAAMYRAKALGRNRVVVFDRTMREDVLSRWELENDLRYAIERDELELEFQPIIDITDDRLVMLEALLRWNHPRRGRLAPDEFIPLAEEVGLIGAIGDFVVTDALGHLAQWQTSFPATPPVCLTVNVSGRQLHDERFPARLSEMIDRAGIIPGTLGIEITESVLLGKELPPQAFEKIKSLGVRLMLDDFGTGYSSLAYLEQYPIDVLKVDQAFVARLEEGAHRHVVLEAILAMAHALKIEVVVEGAESEERIATLRSIGCTWAQGNALSRPLSAHATASLLKERRANPLAAMPGMTIPR